MIRRSTIRIGQLDKPLRDDRWRPLIRASYQLMAYFYDAAARRLLPEYEQAAVDLLDNVQVGTDDYLLDIGCGTGMVTLPAAQRAGRVIGLDMTPNMLDRLREKSRRQSGRRPALVRGDARFLPLETDSHTVVTTSFMLVHLSTEDKRRVFSDVRRVLSSQGRFGCLTSRHSVGDAYPTQAEWHRWLTEAGFDEVTIDDVRDIYRIVTARRI